MPPRRHRVADIRGVAAEPRFRMIRCGVYFRLVDFHVCDARLVRPDALVGNRDVPPLKSASQRVAAVTREDDWSVGHAVPQREFERRIRGRLLNDCGREVTRSEVSAPGVLTAGEALTPRTIPVARSASRSIVSARTAIPYVVVCGSSTTSIVMFSPRLPAGDGRR